MNIISNHHRVDTTTSSIQMSKLKIKERSFVQGLSPWMESKVHGDLAEQVGLKSLKLSIVKDTVVQDKCKLYEMPGQQANQNI